MKRTGFLIAAAVLSAALAGCSSGSERTAEEWSQRYAQAIANHGGEMVEYTRSFKRWTRRIPGPPWLWSLWG